MSLDTVSSCPGDDRLDAYARGQEVEPALRSHVEECPRCREALAEIQQNNAFLGEMVPAVKDRSGAPVVGLASEAPIPGYDILREVSRGGQGVVYQAIQLATKRTVALKVPLSGNLATLRQRQRFEREIEIIAGLRHPHIVTLYGTETLPQGRTVLVMEYVEGQPLDEYVSKTESRKPKADIDELLRLFVKICEAVNYAHQRGILHRDLKPANVLVVAEERQHKFSRDSSEERDAGCSEARLFESRLSLAQPRILDFGLAKAIDGDALSAHVTATLSGEFMGTLAYAAPESVKGDPKGIDTRTDVYALGVMLYEALTGQLPYPMTGSLADGVRSILEAAPTKPSTHNRLLDDELDTIVLKALAKDQDRRYQSAHELAQDLERYLGGDPIHAKSESAWYVLRKSARRHKMPLAAAAGFVVLLAAFAVSMSIQAGRMARQRNEAERQRILAESSLSRSNIERGRLMAIGGNLAAAEELLWGELLRPPPSEAEGSGGSDAPSTGSNAYWALRELYSRQPCRLTIAAHAGDATQVVFGKDGSSLISFGEDDHLKQWSLPEGTLLRSKKLGCQGFSSADFSADGRQFACVAQDGSRNLVNCLEWSSKALPGDGADPTRMLDLSADGALLATAGTNGFIELYDTESPRAPRRLEGHKGVVSRLCFSADGRYLVSASEGDSTLCLWDVTRGRALRTLEKKASPWPMLCSHPDGNVLAFTGRGNEEFAWWDIGEGGVRTPVVRYGSSIESLAYSPDGRILVVGGADGTATLVDAHTERRIASYSGHTGGLGSIAFRADGGAMATASVDGRVRVWDVPPFSDPRVLTGHLDTAMSVQFSAESGLLASASGDGTIRLWDPSTGQSRTTLAAHSPYASALAFDPRGGILASGGYDGLVKLWDLASGEVRYSFAAGVNRVAHVAYRPDGRMLAVSGDEPFVNLWDLGGEPRLAKRLLEHTLRIPMVQFSPDGEWLVTGGNDRSLVLWDAVSGQVRGVLREHQGPVRSVQFSPDGKLLASAGDDATVKLWEAESGRCVQTLRGHRGQVFAACFSPDGRLLASGDGSGTIKLWDPTSGAALLTLASGATVFSLSFSLDGRWLAAGGSMPEPVRLWDMTYYDRHIAGNLEYQLERVGLDTLDSKHVTRLRARAAATRTDTP